MRRRRGRRRSRDANQILASWGNRTDGRTDLSQTTKFRAGRELGHNLWLRLTLERLRAAASGIQVNIDIPNAPPFGMNVVKCI